MSKKSPDKSCPQVFLLMIESPCLALHFPPPEKSRGKSQGQLGMQSFKHLMVHWLCMASPWEVGIDPKSTASVRPLQGLPRWARFLPRLPPWTHQVLLGETVRLWQGPGSWTLIRSDLRKISVLANHLQLSVLCVNRKLGTGRQMCGLRSSPSALHWRKKDGAPGWCQVSASSFIEWPWRRNTDFFVAQIGVCSAIRARDKA